MSKRHVSSEGTSADALAGECVRREDAVGITRLPRVLRGLSFVEVAREARAGEEIRESERPFPDGHVPIAQLQRDGRTALLVSGTSWEVRKGLEGGMLLRSQSFSKRANVTATQCASRSPAIGAAELYSSRPERKQLKRRARRPYSFF